MNDNPKSILYRGYNFKFKTTDLEYIQLHGEFDDFKIDNKLYTYRYRNKERNGDNQTDLGATPVVPTAGFGTPNGPAGNLDVRGNRTINEYRDTGDVFDISRGVNAGLSSGTLKAGVWYEHQDNHRELDEVDWTLGGIPAVAPGGNPATFFGKNALGQTGAGATLYNLQSVVDTTQPFVQYEWTPIPNVRIIPGVKYIDFSRHQSGPVNQTSLIPVDFTADYSATLGYLSELADRSFDLSLWADRAGLPGAER